MKTFVCVGVVLLVAVLVPCAAWSQTERAKGVAQVEDSNGLPVVDLPFDLLNQSKKKNLGRTGQDGRLTLEYQDEHIATGTPVEVVYKDCEGKESILLLPQGAAPPEDDCDDTRLGLIWWSQTGEFILNTGTGELVVKDEPTTFPRFVFGGGLTAAKSEEHSGPNPCDVPPPDFLRQDSCSFDNSGIGGQVWGEIRINRWVGAGFEYHDLPEITLSDVSSFVEPEGATATIDGFFDAKFWGFYGIVMAPTLWAQPYLKVTAARTSEHSGGRFLVKSPEGSIVQDESSDQRSDGWNAVPELGINFGLPGSVAGRAGIQFWNLETDTTDDEGEVNQDVVTGVFSFAIEFP
jgi:hypothetical protein